MGEMTKAEMRQKLGNISQLQELLFGEQTREYDRKLDLYQAKLEQLESDCQKSQLSIDKRLEELESKLIEQINSAINSLEKKVQSFNTSTKKEQEQIKTNLDLVAQQTRDRIDFLQNSIKTQNNNFIAEITQSKVALDEEMCLLKQQITERLNYGLSELSAGKISRSDLAEVLIEVCLKLKESDQNFELSNNTKKLLNQSDCLSDEIGDKQ